MPRLRDARRRPRPVRPLHGVPRRSGRCARSAATARSTSPTGCSRSPRAPGSSFSLLLLIWRSSHTSIRELQLDPGSGVYHDVTRHGALESLPDVLVARVDGPLFFADADRFQRTLRALVAARPATRAVVVDTQAIFLTDTDGADTGCWGHRVSRWRRAGLLDALGEDVVHPTLADAVEALSAPGAGPAPRVTPLG